MIPLPAFLPMIFPIPDATAVTFQAIIPFGHLTQEEMAATEILAQAMSRETEDYTAGKIRLIVAGAGDEIHWDATADHLRLSFTVPRADEGLGFSLFASMLQHPLLNEETVKNAQAAVAATPLTSWRFLLSPSCSDPSKVRPSEVVRIYGTLFRPERVVVAVGGAVDPTKISDEFKLRLGDWHPVKPRVVYEPELPPWTTLLNPPVVSLPGPAISSAAGSFTADLLATFALGVGKGASVFRVWREQNRWSYAQEAGIEGTPEGLRLDSWLVTAADSLGDRAKEATTALLSDIQTWTEADRSRALAMAESVLLRGLNFSPFWFSSHGPLGDSLSDRVFLSAYWKLKTGQDWDADALLTKMKAVSLDDLKAAATAYLSHVTPRTSS